MWQENGDFRNAKLENQAGPDNVELCRLWTRIWILF